MASKSPPPLFLILFLFFGSSHLSLGHQLSVDSERREGVGKGIGIGRRILMSFKETPSGGNSTFECSPSGPCVPCLYSEKNDEKYRCSETGYRIPFRCVETGVGSNEANKKKSQKSRSTLEIAHDNAKSQVKLHDEEGLTSSIRHRSVLDDSSTSKEGSQAYITYRSCIPAVNEEKISVLGFEGIIVGMLLLSSSVVYFRRKRSNGAMSGVGAVRNPTNSRF